MMNLDRLLVRINAVLDGDAEGFEARALASEYAAHGESVRERMRQCVSLIKSGNTNAAFQVAETAPPVLDLAAKLAFDRSARWREYCRENRLPVAHRMEDSLVEQVNALYAQGIDEAHPLYRDYRAAMRERDDMRALGVLRSIVRINTTDANARTEFDRLTAKLRREFLIRLHDARAHNRESEIIGILGEMDAAGLGPCPDKPEWIEAVKIRDEWERKRALGDAITLIPKIIALRDAGEWEGAIPLLGQARALQKQYGFHWPPTEGQVIATTETWVAGHASVVEKLRAEEEKTEDLHRRLDEMEKRVAEDKNKSRDKKFIEADIATADTWISEAEGLPETAHFGHHIHRAKRVRSKLSGILHRRRNRQTWLAVAAAAIVGTLVSVGLNYAREAAVERNFRDGLARAESAKGVKPLLVFLAGPVREHADLAALGDHPVRIAALRARAEEADHALHRLSVDADALAKDAAGTARISLLKPRLATLESSVETLAEDQREEGRAKVAVAARAIAEREARDAANADDTIAKASDALAALLPAEGATDFKAGADFAGTAQALRDALFLAASAKETTVAVARDRLSRADAITGLSAGIADATAKLSRAESLDTHLGALATLAALPGSAPEITAARRVTEAADALRKSPANLFLPAAAAMARAVDVPASFIAAEPGAVEVSAAGKLALLARFSGAWRAVRTKYFPDGSSSSVTVYLKGRPEYETSQLSGGTEKRVKAEIFKADGSVEKVALSLRKFDGRSPDGEALEDAAVSKEGELIASASRLYDTDRAAFNESPIALLDRTLVSEAAPLLKAWIQQETLKVMAERPEAWGAVFAPEIKRDGDRLAALLGSPIGPGAWLTPERTGELRKKLTAYYAEKRAPYQPAVEARLTMVKSVVGAGAAYAGRTDISGAATIRTSGARPGDRLFGLDADGKPAVLGEVDADGKPVLRHTAAPYSPLLRLAAPPTNKADLDIFLPKP